ncbi:hypothetical protein CCMA1212_003511 [Trichoderma ghanense]|uniref:Prion-inhibition and propagation HeLo domain-containing protein n=1 Tax=Trichoderma ghanense TaxID=65468 RepID=A0ABY2H9I5_9HYPO
MISIGDPASTLHLVQRAFHSLLRARGFEDDFGVYQLQLQVHLSRCAAIINNANRPANVANVPELALQGPEATISENLLAIQETLRKAQREAAQLRAHLLEAAGGHLEATSTWSANTPLIPKTMRLQPTGFLDKRRIQAAKKMEALKWAFYKKDNCDKFIAEISALLLHLERQVNARRDARFLLVASPWHLDEATHDST